MGTDDDEEGVDSGDDPDTWTDGEPVPGDPDDASGGDSDPTIVPEHDALLLDAMLGGLTSYLRMCGYDAAYALDRGVEADEEVRELAVSEARRLLTRDRDLAARTPGSVLLTERETTDQLRELRDAGVDLSLADRPVRCGACNGPVERAADEEARPDYVPDGERAWRCVDCGQWFWRGSHWDDVAATLADL